MNRQPKPRPRRLTFFARRRTPPNRKLATEPLESRRLLTNFTVTTLNDSGPGSLREAVELANANPGADNIVFDSSLFGEVNLGSNGDIAITDSVTIDGGSFVAIGGNNESRVFDVSDQNDQSQIDVTLQNLTVSGGAASYGGGIVNSENLTLENTTISGNSALFGGGIFNGANGNLNVSNSTVTDNRAEAAPYGGGGQGGGIANDGNATINNSNISDNYAFNSGGGVDSRGDLSITGGTVANNDAGIGGGVNAQNGSFDATNSNFEGNSSSLDGGGLNFNNAESRLTNSTVTGNTAKTGGGIAVSNGSTIIDNSQVSNNQATGTGGYSDGKGGGVVSFSAMVQCNASTLTGNIAAANGGGLYGAYGASIQSNNCQLNNNQAPKAAGFGMDGYSNASVQGGQISGNHASELGGGFATPSRAPNNAGDGFRFGPPTLKFDNVVFSNNLAPDAAGMSIGGNVRTEISNTAVVNNFATSGTGGIRFEDQTIATISNSTIAANSGQSAGGMRIDGGNLTIESTTVATNSSTGDSGGLFADASANVVMKNSIVADNSADGTGNDIAGAVTSDFSLIGDSNGAIINGSNNRLNQDPQLGPLADNGGNTPTLSLASSSPAVNAGDPDILSPPSFDQRGEGFDRIVASRIDMGSFEFQNDNSIDGDFNDDGRLDCEDIDALVAEIVAGSNDLVFDLSGDGVVDGSDQQIWLAEAGAANLASGNPYLIADANLDGVVDVGDFNIWNTNKFSLGAGWCGGDFNSDGSTDVSDFNLWNTNKFFAADSTRSIGEFQSGDLEDAVTPAVNLATAGPYAQSPGGSSQLSDRQRLYRVADSVFAEV